MKTKVYTGKKGHLFANYLDHYPFPYYLLIRSIQTLPEILSDTLTQWFEMINSRDDLSVSYNKCFDGVDKKYLGWKEIP